MAFPIGNDPYIMRVQKVILNGNDVVSATLRFENVTKSEYKEITGNIINSNGSYNLGGIGEWDEGDEIKITATKEGNTGFKIYTIIEVTDHGQHDFGIVTIGGNPYWYYNLLKRRN